MVESRWLRWIGPGLVALGAVGLIASTTVGAGPRAWTPRRARTDADASLRPATPPAAPADFGRPWFRLDPVAAGDGSLRGQRLVARPLRRPGDAGTRPPRRIVRRRTVRPVVLAGSDDGIDVAPRIGRRRGRLLVGVGTERDVIRRATIDQPGRVLYEMRVDRTTRADLGIWRRRSTGAPRGARPRPDRARRALRSHVLDRVPVGPRRRPLAVQSCGEFACRTRLLDPGRRRRRGRSMSPISASSSASTATRS